MSHVTPPTPTPSRAHPLSHPSCQMLLLADQGVAGDGRPGPQSEVSYGLIQREPRACTRSRSKGRAGPAFGGTT